MSNMSGSTKGSLGNLQRRARHAWLWFAIALLLAAGVTAYASREFGRSSAIAALEEQGRTEANLKVALLRAVLERPRALPLVLSQDRDITDALATKSPSTIDKLNRKLEGLIKDTKAAVIYVIGTDGIAIASSNWQEPLSFVGNDYTFREYFRGAMKSGIAEHFALGSVSKRPGLYISRRIGATETPLGVVVVKMEFDQLEADWRDTGRPTYVVDDRGVVLITSIPSWRFMTIQPLAADRLSTIRRSLQFGDAPLQPLPFWEQAVLSTDAVEVRAVLPGTGESAFLRLAAPVATTPWVLQYLLPLEPALSTGMRQAMLATLAGLVPLFLLAALVLWRRQAAALRLARELQAREHLEQRVLERTEALSRARDRLEIEISEHRSTEEKLQGVQQELVAANRLAILGQVAAGVAHEINQPVATIRAYADNARVFLERSQTAPAVENLTSIAALTERIGTITDELKAFARKGRTAPEPIALRDVIEGAVVLLRSRFAGRMEALDIRLPPAEIRVLGNRIRLEQVFINLFQNALEALENTTSGRIEVRAEETSLGVVITIADNGPGIPPEILDVLFTPFNTSKERGLGLGLVISKEILADYGGSIDVKSNGSGTCFTIHLKKA
jgi:two-component system C4-dicarboxylate transport sensor histidine kinase DctB